MQNDFYRILSTDILNESVLDDYEGDFSSQASKIEQTVVNPFNPKDYAVRIDLFCGADKSTAEQIEDYADMCRVALRKFSWPHSDVIITTTNKELANQTNEVCYDPECGKTWNGENGLRVSFEYNIPEKVSTDEIFSLMQFFSRTDNLMRIILKRDPIYNMFYSHESPTDGFIWKYIRRPDGIEGFDQILYPKQGVVRNGNNTEAIIRDISNTIIMMAAHRISARQTIPALRLIFKNQNKKLKERAKK